MIVPAYQAADSLGLCLDALNAQTVARDLYEVIVVDDGSTDGTGEIAQQAGAQVITQPNAGPPRSAERRRRGGARRSVALHRCRLCAGVRLDRGLGRAVRR